MRPMLVPWPRWRNPTPSYGIGAAAGAVAGGVGLALLGAVAMHALTGVQMGQGTTEQSRRAQYAFGLLLAVGAGTGAYFAAAPHQRVGAAVGATLLAGAAWTALTWSWKGPHHQDRDAQYAGALLLAPAVGAMTGAIVAGTTPQLGAAA